MTVKTSAIASPESPPRLKAVRVKHWGQWVTATVVIVCVAGLVYSVAGNENIHYPSVAEFLFSPAVLNGLWMTFALSIIGMAAGTAFGVLIALAKMSNNRLLETIASGYIWLFRGVPLLVQMLVWGNFALLFPALGLGIPFTDIMFFQIPTNSVIVPFVAACSVWLCTRLPTWPKWSAAACLG